jgi:hypothetical protein
VLHPTDSAFSANEEKRTTERDQCGFAEASADKKYGAGQNRGSQKADARGTQKKIKK